jgi:hypothetical protein
MTWCPFTGARTKPRASRFGRRPREIPYWPELIAVAIAASALQYAGQICVGHDGVGTCRARWYGQYG